MTCAPHELIQVGTLSLSYAAETRLFKCVPGKLEMSSNKIGIGPKNAKWDMAHN